MADDQIPTWHVLGPQIREETQLAEHGTGMAQVHVVPYMIDSGAAKGHVGVLKVAPRDYYPEFVKDAIDEAVGNTHGIATLGTTGA